MKQELFGQLPDKTPVKIYTFSNKHGMEVKVCNYGATITSIKVPDKEGILGQVILGFDDLSGYLQEAQPFLGCVIGRYANRIAQGKFSIDGKHYQLTINNASNHLHGGIKNFSKVVWEMEPFSKKKSKGAILKYQSKDGEEGYPGNLDCTLTYTLTDNNTLLINYEAITDKPTIVNLTNHCYFNLKDGGRSPILDHELKIYANYFTSIDKNCLPTGEYKSVKNTPFDFLNWKRIGAQITKKDKQLLNGNGYDHNYIINENKDDFKIAAKVYDKETGRLMIVHTTEPGIQFYTSNWFDGTLKGHNGWAYQRYCAFCLETQHFPNSPNQSHFPSVVLRPSEKYLSATSYRFTIK